MSVDYKYLTASFLIVSLNSAISLQKEFKFTGDTRKVLEERIKSLKRELKIRRDEITRAIDGK